MVSTRCITLALGATFAAFMQGCKSKETNPKNVEYLKELKVAFEESTKKMEGDDKDLTKGLTEFGTKAEAALKKLGDDKEAITAAKDSTAKVVKVADADKIKTEDDKEGSEAQAAAKKFTEAVKKVAGDDVAVFEAAFKPAKDQLEAWSAEDKVKKAADADSKAVVKSLTEFVETSKPKAPATNFHSGPSASLN